MVVSGNLSPPLEIDFQSGTLSASIVSVLSQFDISLTPAPPVVSGFRDNRS